MSSAPRGEAPADPAPLSLSRREEAIAYLSLAATMLFWSGNSIVGRMVSADVPPFFLAFVRWTGALILLTPFAWRQCVADAPVLRRHIGAVLLLGVAGVAAFNALLYSGLRYTTASNSLLLQAAIPPLVLLIGYLVFRDRARRTTLAGVTVSMLGVIVVISRADVHLLLGLRFQAGDLLTLAAVLAWSIYTVCLRLKPPVAGTSFLFATFVIAAVCMAALSLTELDRIRAIPLTGTVLFGFAYVCVLPSLVAYLLFNRSVGVIGPARAAQMISLMPLFGALLASLILSEPLGRYHFAGMALILAGILISALRRPRVA